MSDLSKRFNSLMVATALSGGSKATNFDPKTTGSPERSEGPPGAWQLQDVDRVESILTAAVRDAERLLGILWKSGSHVANKIKPHDEREWQIHILSNPEYIGKPSSIVAANEGCEEWDVRNLRRRHGRDARGEKDTKRTCEKPGCTVCSAVEQVATVDSPG